MLLLHHQMSGTCVEKAAAAAAHIWREDSLEVMSTKGKSVRKVVSGKCKVQWRHKLASQWEQLKCTSQAVTLRVSCCCCQSTITTWKLLEESRPIKWVRSSRRLYSVDCAPKASTRTQANQSKVNNKVSHCRRVGRRLSPANKLSFTSKRGRFFFYFKLVNVRRSAHNLSSDYFHTVQCKVWWKGEKGENGALFGGGGSGTFHSQKDMHMAISEFTD